MEAARIPPNHPEQPKPRLVPFSPKVEPEIITPEILEAKLASAMWPNKTPEEIAEIRQRRQAKQQAIREAQKAYQSFQEEFGRRKQIVEDSKDAIGLIIELSMKNGDSIKGVLSGFTDYDPYHRTVPNIPYNHLIITTPESQQHYSTHDIRSTTIANEQLPFVWEGDNS